MDAAAGVTTRNILAGKKVDPPDYGAFLLDKVLEFTTRFVAYPSNETAIAHVLWIAHAHGMGAWETTPRIAFLSPEPASGKTRALEVTEVLVPRPVEAVNVTPAALWRLVEGEDGLATIIHDEIDTVFGPRAKENEEIRGMLNAGHRRGAKAWRCVVRGKNIEVEPIEAYCAVALAGIGNLPDTILTRAVVVPMKRRSAHEAVAPFRRRKVELEAYALRDTLADWVGGIEDLLSEADPSFPDGIADRDADVWEPLLAIADAAGGAWPSKARVAAVALVALTKEKAPSLGIRLLADLQTVFGSADHLSTETILTELKSLDESPWSDLRGKPLEARKLASLLSKYEIKSTTVRIGEATPKGYRRTDLHDAWQRYLGPSPHSSATTATFATDPLGDDPPPGWE